MTLHIKNMVCPRCIEAVKSVLDELGLPYQQVTLGEAALAQNPEKEILEAIKLKLQQKGFDLLEDKKAKIVEKVKNLILQLVNAKDAGKHLKLSDYLAKNIGHDYSHISSIFSSNQGITIEKYYILQKIERAKELLTYDEMNLSEIAHELHYSSTAALSAQFKDVTGMTPTEFKKLGPPNRKSLDNVV